ncbi:MAG: ubiquinone/menaquinone biosynthesis methyltransferase [Myxococcota bacterium]|nr:ubiquinone/menaquinone biosynthesis methyltransferase [Myxococcota bacterium]
MASLEPGEHPQAGLNALPSAEEKREKVQSMFDRIAPRYDLLNRMMSAGMDQSWRRRALALADVGAGDVVLDLACGTGDLSELARERGARVVGADFSRQMLFGAHARAIGADFVQGDAAQLPLAEGSVTVVTCGFALRNFVSLGPVFDELARVLVPGGRISLIDVDRPASGIVRAGHSLYFDRIIPFVGGLVSDRDAYRYLPQSTVYLPPAEEIFALLAKSGFEQIAKHRLMLGAAQILTGQLPGDDNSHVGAQR